MAPSDDSTSTIPIVDFGAFLNGSDEAKEQVARQLDDAFRDVGFVYLRNHGVRREVVEECFEWVCHATHSLMVLDLFPVGLRSVA